MRPWRKEYEAYKILRLNCIYSSMKIIKTHHRLRWTMRRWRQKAPLEMVLLAWPTELTVRGYFTTEGLAWDPNLQPFDCKFESLPLGPLGSTIIYILYIFWNSKYQVRIQAHQQMWQLVYWMHPGNVQILLLLWMLQCQDTLNSN